MVLYSLVFSAQVGFLQGYESVRVDSYEWLWIVGWVVLTAVGLVFQLRGRKAKVIE